MPDSQFLRKTWAKISIVEVFLCNRYLIDINTRVYDTLAFFVVFFFLVSCSFCCFSVGGDLHPLACVATDDCTGALFRRPFWCLLCGVWVRALDTRSSRVVDVALMVGFDDGVRRWVQSQDQVRTLPVPEIFCNITKTLIKQDQGIRHEVLVGQCCVCSRIPLKSRRSQLTGFFCCCPNTTSYICQSGLTFWLNVCVPLYVHEYFRPDLTLIALGPTRKTPKLRSEPTVHA